jgi:hypothetical protein
MNNTQLMDCTQSSTGTLERVNFFNRQLLTASDMTTDQDYFIEKLRRHNRYLHGCGVVCGLVVTASPTTAEAWRVNISCGYALGPYGDEIFVGDPVYFDLSKCASSGMTSPCEPGVIVAGAAGTSSTVYLAIKYAQCQARPVQVASNGCGCDNDPCQYSRVRDSFQIQCLNQLPAQPSTPTVTLCQAVLNPVLASCPPCPTDPWVVLAKITLPGSSSMQIAASQIDNVSVRTLVLSTALIQSQVFNCCCGGSTSPQGNLSIAQTYAPVLNSIQTAVSITVTNNSSIAAANVVVTVALAVAANPAGPPYLTATAGSQWTTAGGTPPLSLTSTSFSLAAGANQVLTYDLEPYPDQPQFTVTSAAAVTTTTTGISGGNNSITMTFGKASTGPTGTLNISQSSAPVVGGPGTQVSIAVTNNTSVALSNVAVTVTLTAGSTTPGKPFYGVTTGSQWTTNGGENLASLTSVPVTISVGLVYALTFQILPGENEPPFGVTSVAAASTTTTGIGGATNTITMNFGEITGAGSTT